MLKGTEDQPKAKLPAVIVLSLIVSVFLGVVSGSLKITGDSGKSERDFPPAEGRPVLITKDDVPCYDKPGGFGFFGNPEKGTIWYATKESGDWVLIFDEDNCQ